MKLLKAVALQCTILTAFTVSQSHAQGCSDQAGCLRDASAKIVQTLTPKVVPIFGDYPKLYIHDLNRPGFAGGVGL